MPFSAARGWTSEHALLRLDARRLGVAGAAAVLVCVGVAYAALASVVFVVQDGPAPMFFPAAGMTLAFMYCADTRLRWGAAGTIVVAEVVVDLLHGLDVGTSVVLGLANAGEAVVAASLLGRWFGSDAAAPSPARVGRFFAAAAVGTALSAGVGGSALSVGGPIGEWAATVAAWWLGDLSGQVIVAPLLLMLARRVQLPARMAFELIGSSLVFVAAVVAVFFFSTLPISWALFVLAGFLAVRFGSVGAGIAGLAMAGVVTAATAAREPFMGGLTERRHGELIVAAMLLVIVGATHLLAAEVQMTQRLALAAAGGEVSLRAVIDHAPVAIIEFDAVDSTVLTWNAAAAQTFGVRAESVIGRVLPVDSDWSEHVAQRDAAVADAGARRFSTTRQGRDGRVHHLDIAVQPRFTADGRQVITSIIHDRTADVVLQNDLRSMLERDDLTGLANRTVVVERLEHWCRRPADGTDRVALFCDLDGFKLINDRLGHLAGDRALVEAGVRLAGCVRPDDVVARVGGDEFVVLAAVRGQGAADKLVGRIIAAFAAPFDIDGSPVTVGISVGLVRVVSGMHPAEVLDAADAAMYRDKRNRAGAPANAPYRP